MVLSLRQTKKEEQVHVTLHTSNTQVKTIFNSKPSKLYFFENLQTLNDVGCLAKMNIFPLLKGGTTDTVLYHVSV